MRLSLVYHTKYNSGRQIYIEFSLFQANYIILYEIDKNKKDLTRHHNVYIYAYRPNVYGGSFDGINHNNG